MKYKMIEFKEYPTGEEINDICKNGWKLVSLVSSMYSNVYGYFALENKGVTKNE